MLGTLDRFEGFFQRVMEDSVGRLFRTPIQPAKIGRRLERAMEDHQVVTVNGVMVPNDYRVVMHPEDMVIFADFIPSLCRQMEQWLDDLAEERRYTTVDRMHVQIIADQRVKRRSIHAESAVVEFLDDDRNSQEQVQRTEVMRVIQETGNVPPLYFRFLSGPHSGESFVVRGPMTTIGRAVDNDVVIDSDEVSRHHARIEYHDRQYWLIDLDSTNGSLINGERVSQGALEPGDRLLLGNTAIEVEHQEPGR